MAVRSTVKKDKSVTAKAEQLAKKTKSTHHPDTNEPVRKRKVAKYKSFRLQKKIPHPAGPLPSARRLIGKTRRLIATNWKPLLGIFLIYSFFTIALVRNFSSPIDVDQVKSSLRESFGEKIDGVAATGTILGALLGSTASTSTETSGMYQTMLLIIVSLALIWTFRQSSAGNKPTAKLAFYRGLYPLVPFLLVLFVMATQLLPAFIGGIVFGFVSDAQLAITGIEQALWLLFFGLLILLSLYMLCSSVFALYIVTLPEMTPMKALRTARSLVLSRRFEVLRKILVLPILVFVVLIIVVVPAIYFIPFIAPWLYFGMTLFSIIVLHAYMFVIYRELL